MGGFNGGFLEDDMLLYLNDNLSDAEEKIIPNFSSPQTIKKLRVILGPHENKFEKSQIDKFLSTNWEVTKDINRMGIKLSGDEIKSTAGRDMLSDGNQIGSIQITLKGEPIILLPDRGTIGGYPKIGVVASVDYDRLIQMSPGSKIKFKEINLSDAETLFKLYEMETQNLISQI